jgi:ribosome-associated translation inhibitor RaiA
VAAKPDDKSKQFLESWRVKATKHADGLYSAIEQLKLELERTEVKMDDKVAQHSQYWYPQIKECSADDPPKSMSSNIA